MSSGNCYAAWLFVRFIGDISWLRSTALSAACPRADRPYAAERARSGPTRIAASPVPVAGWKSRPEAPVAALNDAIIGWTERIADERVIRVQDGCARIQR